MTQATKRDIALNVFGSMFYLFCNWVITVLVVTLSSDYEASGSLAVAMAVGNVFASIMLFRVRTVQVADIHDERSTGEYIAHRLLTCVIAFLSCVVYSMFTVSSIDYIPVLLYLMFKAVECFIDVLHGLDQKHGKFALICISQVVRGVLAVCGFVLGIAFLQSLPIAILFMGLTSLLVLVTFDIPQAMRFDKIMPCFALGPLREIFLASGGGFAATLLCTVLVSIVRQIYGLQYGNEALGVYAALATPAVLVQALASYLYVPLIGPIAIDWERGRVKSINKTLIRFALVVILLIIGCMGIFAVCGIPVLSFIFQKDIASNAYLVYPLLVCTGLTALVYFFIDIFMIIGKGVIAVILNAISLVCAMVAMEPSFSIFGANGISVAIIVAFGANVVLSYLSFARFCLHERSIEEV